MYYFIFRFPKKEESCQLWKEICGYNDRDKVSTLVICSAHFIPSDYIDTRARDFGGRMSLKPGAYPSISVPYPKPKQEPILVMIKEEGW